MQDNVNFENEKNDFVPGLKVVSQVWKEMFKCPFCFGFHNVTKIHSDEIYEEIKNNKKTSKTWTLWHYFLECKKNGKVAHSVNVAEIKQNELIFYLNDECKCSYIKLLRNEEKNRRNSIVVDSKRANNTIVKPNLIKLL